MSKDWFLECLENYKRRNQSKNKSTFLLNPNISEEEKICVLKLNEEAERLISEVENDRNRKKSD